MKTKAENRKQKAETGVAPLWQNSPAMLAVFARVAAERSHQRKLFATGFITFDCASVIPDPNRKLRVLMEEVGEVAQELDKLEGLRDRRGERFVLEDLQEELVQVAAVAVAWLESFEVQS
jgi:hypothetical protein